MSTRKKHAQELADEAVGLSYSRSGRTVKAVAASLGIGEPLLHTRRRAKRDHGGKAFTGNGRARDGELVVRSSGTATDQAGRKGWRLPQSAW